MTAIALSDVVYRYSRGGFTLRCPALELAPGELTLITGPNG
ncbi:MAG TPA: methionine ABC transporter ATP-binding protein, partial [Firmicutes bacterium]|nr:methionine ABC transporter ATP-binding protein [Bacillota bacterium]